MKIKFTLAFVIFIFVSPFAKIHANLYQSEDGN